MPAIDQQFAFFTPAERQAKVAEGVPERVMTRAIVALIIALGFTLSPTHHAVAVDVSNRTVDALITETVARREQRQEWDPFEEDATQPIRVDGEPSAGSVPDGIRMGTYMFYPSAGAALVYDDNIYGSDRSKEGDFRTELTPELRFKSDLPRHVFDFSLDGKIVNYVDHSELDYANYRARADAALHFDSAHTIAISASSLLSHDEAGDPLYELSAAEPIAHYEHAAAIGITRDVGRLYGTLAAGYTRRDYSDVRSTSGGVLDQDRRDSDTWIGEFKTGYRISPGFEIIGKLRTSRIYNDGDGTARRDAWSYEALAGFAFETNPLLKWSILGGYGIRDYDARGLDDLNTSLLQADVQWSPTRKLTIYGTLYRQLEDSFTLDGNGIVRQGVKAKAEYEVAHNTILTGTLTYRDDDFLGVRRNDRHFAARVGVDYYLSNNWLFTFGYEHQVRDSTESLLDMHRNRFMVGAKLRY